MSFDFIVTALIVILLPGTGVLYTLAIGLGLGFRASVAAALGCTLGIVPAALASLIGLAAIFHTSALAFQIVKYLGVAYLLYMALSILRSGGALDVNADQTPRSVLRTAFDGAALNVLNPKLSLFFLAFLPQFTPVDAPNAPAMLLAHAGVFMGLTFVVFVGYGACAALVRDYVVTRPRLLNWVRRSFAAAFGALSVKLALTDR